jgi:hypothetical protein
MTLVKLWQFLAHKKTIDDHDDVAITSPQNGDVLTYDASTAQWVNRPPSGGGDPDLLITYVLAGTARLIYTEMANYWAICFPSTYSDLGLISYSSCTSPAQDLLRCRMQDTSNFYAQRLYGAASTQDHQIVKWVAGSLTTLGVEGVDISTYVLQSLKFSAGGTTLRAYRAPYTTLRIVVTDTSFSSGYFGAGTATFYPYGNYGAPIEYWLFARKTTTLSESIEPIAYFEAPVVGDGSVENPYRPTLPYEAFEDSVLGVRNRLALTWSALIPCDRSSGRPVEYRCILRVYPDSVSDPMLRGIDRRLSELESLNGVRRLTRDEALKEALKLDDKLHIYDLVRVSRCERRDIDEYVSWRRSVFGVDMDSQSAERYLRSGKGW